MTQVLGLGDTFDSVGVEKTQSQCNCSEAADMNGRFQMQGGKNWILPK